MDVRERSINRARQLRRTMTRAEVILWSSLRGKQLAGLKFRRQHPYGPYVLDFYCLARRLAVEVDGGIHQLEERALRDAPRDEQLAAHGIRVLRIPNDLALNDLEAARRLIEGAALKSAAYPDVL